jgi:DnaJ-class molecular chaperone
MPRPKYCKKVPNEGMPIPFAKVDATNFSKPLPKGDLYIRFDIVFPKSLSEDQKQEIRKMFAQ